MEENVKKLLDLRSRLEERIRELEEELSLLKEIMSVIEELVKSQSITTAEALLEKKPDLGNLIEKREIKSRVGGETLGHAEIYERGIIIRPIRPFNKDHAAFKRFFRDKLLEGYKQEDEKLVSEGELGEDEAFQYEVKVEDDKVTCIIIRNYRTEERLREILRATRWTLERVLKETLSQQE